MEGGLVAYLHLFKQLWYYSFGSRSKVLLFIFLHAFSHLGALGYPLIFAQILNTIQKNEATLLPDVAIWLGVWVLIFTIDAIFHRLGRILEFQVSYKVYRRFINAQYKKIIKLPLSWHTNNHSGSVVNRINTAATALREFTEAQFEYVGLAVMFWGPIMALSVLSYQAALIAFVVAIIAIFVIYRFDLKLIKLYQELNENRHYVASGIFDYISNIKTIITLRLGKKTAQELDGRLEKGYGVHVQSEGIVNGLKWTSVGFLILLLQLSILLHYIWTQHFYGQVILVGNLVAMYQYLEKLSQTFFNIASGYQRVLSWQVNYEAILPIQSAQVASKQSNLSSDISDWHWGSIKNLTFSYKDHKENLVIDELKFQRFEKIALVGESGSGKSTLLSLMRGLYKPERASLQLDKQTFESLEPLYLMTTLMPQEPEIFENTILYNVTFGLNYPAQEVEKAIQLACFDKVIKRLPKGLETDLREKGVNLSGGERQRLSLVRGILAATSSQVILMDEPTSSVDVENEVKIYDQILNAFSDKLVISSVHRLHLLAKFDRVLILDNGRIVQDGTFEVLKGQSGLFKTLWAKYS